VCVDMYVHIYPHTQKNNLFYLNKFLLNISVSTHVLALLAAENIQPAGLFLEAPFNNIADELTEHPFAQVFQILFSQT